MRVLVYVRLSHSYAARWCLKRPKGLKGLKQGTQRKRAQSVFNFEIFTEELACLRSLIRSDIHTRTNSCMQTCAVKLVSKYHNKSAKSVKSTHKLDKIMRESRDFSHAQIQKAIQERSSRPEALIGALLRGTATLEAFLGALFSSLSLNPSQHLPLMGSAMLVDRTTPEERQKMRLTWESALDRVTVVIDCRQGQRLPSHDLELPRSTYHTFRSGF